MHRFGARIIINCFISLSFYGTVDYFIQFSIFIFIRVCKPSGVPLVLPSTWRSKVATGDSSSTTATGKRRRGKLCRGSATPRSCATAASSPAENNPPLFAFGEISSATAHRTVATGRMNLLAVDFCFQINCTLATFSPQTLKTTQIELLLATSRSAGSRIAFARNQARRFPGIFVLEARTALKSHRWSP